MIDMAPAMIFISPIVFLSRCQATPTLIQDSTCKWWTAIPWKNCSTVPFHLCIPAVRMWTAEMKILRIGIGYSIYSINENSILLILWILELGRCWWINIHEYYAHHGRVNSTGGAAPPASFCANFGASKPKGFGLGANGLKARAAPWGRRIDGYKLPMVY